MQLDKLNEMRQDYRNTLLLINKKKTYSGRDAWQEYHWACTQPPAASRRRRSNIRSNSQASCASASLLPKLHPETPIQKYKIN